MRKHKKNAVDSLPRNKRIMSQLVLLLEQCGKGDARCVIEAKQEILKKIPPSKCDACRYARGRWTQYDTGETGQ